jgi:hypothetical protein
MANVVVLCPGDVTQQQTGTDPNFTYTVQCSQPWLTEPAPTNALDAQEFAGFFFGVLVSTLTFYFLGVLPLGAFLRFIRQSIRDLL